VLGGVEGSNSLRAIFPVDDFGSSSRNSKLSGIR
jgi:hypothetical protein